MSERLALLQIDVADSTRLVELLGDETAAMLWADHDRLARQLIRKWHGREIDKSDGFLLTFAEPTDALRCALEYHRAVSTLKPPLLARAGLHFASLIVRRNDAGDVALGAKPVEVEGAAKATVARVMSLARPGQTLLTSQMVEAVEMRPFDVIDHGRWKLKGFEEPVAIFETGDGTDRPMPPADNEKAYRVIPHGRGWRPVAAIPSTVPDERDAFVGRRDVLKAIRDRFVAGARLLSVVGMGGIGKTRLASHFARTAIGEFPGGIWFCDLSQARGLDDIFLATAQGLGLSLGKADPRTQLGNAMAGRETCLVIFDNFEQIVHQASETLGVWMGQAPNARFLVTTREILRIAGEHIVEVEPLSIHDGVALFLSRARDSGLPVSQAGGESAAVTQLVRLLDGLPLAIELAAARLSVMSPAAMVARIGERFKLLSSRGGRVGRHLTLKTTFDWSWDLLGELERAALGQLTVFVGGITLDSAEAVIEVPASEPACEVVDLIQSLVEKSFLRRRGDRFDMLESVREYAAERLRHDAAFAQGGAVERAQARHGAFFANLARRFPNEPIFDELDNLVTACRRAVRRDDSAIAAATCVGAWDVLGYTGPYRLAAELIDAVLAMSGHDEVARCRLEGLRGRSKFMSGDLASARSHFEVALEFALRRGSLSEEGKVRSSLAELNLVEGRTAEARDQYRQALDRARSSNDRLVECAVLNGLGTYFDHLGDFQAARRHFEDALGVARQIGNRRWEGGALGNLGQALANLGLNSLALDHYNQAVLMARVLRDRVWEGNMLCNLGVLTHAEGASMAAGESLRAALGVAREAGAARLESVVQCNLGIVYEALGEHEAALDAYERALAIAQTRRDPRCEGQFQGYLGLFLARQDRATEARACLRSAEATLRRIGDAVSLGILLASRAQAELLLGDDQAAAAALDEACAIVARSQAAPKSELAVAVAMASEMRSSRQRAASEPTSPRP